MLRAADLEARGGRDDVQRIGPSVSSAGAGRLAHAPKRRGTSRSDSGLTSASPIVVLRIEHPSGHCRASRDAPEELEDKGALRAA